MIKQENHAVLPSSTIDENSRQQFIGQLGKYLLNQVSTGNKIVYEKKVLPAFLDENRRKPQTRHEIRNCMNKQPFYQMASACQNNVQKMMWDSVDETIHRQRTELIKKAKEISKGETIGSLNLNPDFKLPSYIANNDHHHMPGGFSSDLTENDITAGALYDKGAYIYTQGLFGSRMDGIGKAASLMILKSFPNIKPKKILQIGCTSGGSTGGLLEAFPNADLHAIDVGPALLRYAHARAESMRLKIHFHQMNGESMTFSNNNFDLVCCLASLHEMSHQAVFKVFSEAYRVLKPNGVFLVSELPPYEGVDVWTQFVRDWDTYNNNEPFWGTLHEMNLREVAESAGFKRENYWQGFGPGIAEANELKKNIEVKNEKFMGSTRGGGDAWYAHMKK